MAGHDFTTLMAALDSPLIVVTTADERERAGCLVGFHGQSSIEPQRYCYGCPRPTTPTGWRCTPATWSFTS